MKQFVAQSLAVTLLGVLAAACSLNPIGEDPGISNGAGPSGEPMAQVVDPSLGTPEPTMSSDDEVLTEDMGATTITPDGTVVITDPATGIPVATDTPPPPVAPQTPAPIVTPPGESEPEMPPTPVAPGAPTSEPGGNVPDEDGGIDGGMPFEFDAGEAEAGTLDAGAPEAAVP